MIETSPEVDGPPVPGDGGPWRVAAVQMVSGPQVEPNLAQAGELLAEAAAGGARLAVLPEYFALIGRQDGDKLAVREPFGEGPIQTFLAQSARRHGLWLVGGSIPLEAPDPARVFNACLLFDPQGRCAARYDKMHLFGLDLPGARFDESRSVLAGERPCAADTPLGRLGLSVCYDVRFPELYRGLGEPDVICVPSAFTVPTGRAHWEVLLRARAIENQAWVVAAAQGGVHPTGRETWGHSLVVDPWGDVVASRPQGPGVVFATIDPRRLQDVRARLPALRHRRAGPA
jgi:predicted amidohydrolase